MPQRAEVLKLRMPDWTLLAAVPAAGLASVAPVTPPAAVDAGRAVLVLERHRRECVEHWEQLQVVR